MGFRKIGRGGVAVGDTAGYLLSRSDYRTYQV